MFILNNSVYTMHNTHVLILTFYNNQQYGKTLHDIKAQNYEMDFVVNLKILVIRNPSKVLF